MIEHFDAKQDYWFSIYTQTDTFPGYNLNKQHEATLATVAAHLQGSGRILDVGCGAGFTALALADMGYQVSGIDLAPKMIERAQHEAGLRGLNIDFRVSGAESLPYEAAGFDAVIALGLMGNLREDQPTLREMYRVLKPGGLLVLSMPNFCGLDRWLSLPRTYALILGHRFRLLRRRIVNMARRLVGKEAKPLSAVRYGRSAVPAFYARRLRNAGFIDVHYTALTFGSFTPLGFKLWGDPRQIAISEWLAAGGWFNWGGNIMLYYGKKPNR